jgi:hypothetical protein
LSPMRPLLGTPNDLCHQVPMFLDVLCVEVETNRSPTVITRLNSNTLKPRDVRLRDANRDLKPH